MAYNIGQKVVCVDDSGFTIDRMFGPFGGLFIPNRPVEGVVYTIRAFYKDAMLLQEIVNPELPFEDGIREPGFLMTRFRPVVTTDTDISVFTEILNTAKAPEKVN